MPDIRCPMCGSTNPDDAQVCRVCQARLKPLSNAPANPFDMDLPFEDQGTTDDTAGQFSQEINQGAGNESPEQALPDWLRGLNSSQESSGPSAGQNEPADQAEPAGEVPDWLARIRQRNQGDSPGADPFSSFAFEEDSGESGQPDWMRPDQPEQAPTEAGQSFDDWQAASEEPAGLQPGAQDWLTNLRGGQDFSSAEPQPWEETQSEQAQPWELQDTGAGEPPAGSEFDSSRKAASSSGSSSSSDWLSELEAWEPLEPEAKTGEPAQPDAGQDWLAGFGAEQAGEESSTPFDGFSEPAEQETPPAESGPGDLPTWFSSDEPPVPPAVPPASDELELPDWLAAGPSTPGQSNNADLDWLSSEPAEEEEQRPSPVSASSFEIEIEGEQPEWLSGVKPTEELPQSSPPAFIYEEDAPLVPPSSPLISHPFAGEDIPEWLNEAVEEPETPAAPQPPPAPQSPRAEPQSDDLAPAQLPGWLQAMRPVEAATTNLPPAVPADTHRVESAGPLAGLQGVLPGEDLARRYRKPPAYSVRLKVTERQKGYADRLDSLVQSEAHPQTVRSQAAVAPQWLVRLMLAFLLIAAIAVSAEPAAPSGGARPVDLFNFSNLVEALPPDAPVLLAVEYDPGYSGEMKLAAVGLVERLMARNVRLALVSTVPAGPVLAEELLQTAAADLAARGRPGADYSRADRVVNLGFLPGGITSLQEFAHNPVQAARYGFGGDADGLPWLSPVLQGISDVEHFAMVIVLTDSGDTGRAWIEQVQPELNGKPLMMVSSSQAGPMLQPYAASGQVQGLIAGMMDGAAYQQVAAGEEGKVPASWVGAGGLRSGMYLGLVFVLIGILFQGMLFATHKKS